MNKIVAFRNRLLLGNRISLLINILLILSTLVVSNYVLEYSSHYQYQNGTFSMLSLPPAYYLLSIATMGILFIVIFLICNRIWLTCGILNGMCGILAVINYFVIKYHGAALSFLLLRNLTTAMNVVDGYAFYVDRVVLRIAQCTCMICAAAVLTGFFTNLPVLPRKKTWLRDGILIAVCVAVFCVGYLGENPVKPKKVITFRWDDSYREYGFLPCTVETLFQMINVVNMPPDYSASRLDQIPDIAASGETGETPDIILILNEALFDLRIMGDFPTDVAYFEAFDTLDNCLHGYALSPRINGGTNISEYEILSSNSTYLMPGVTPFQELKLAGANSIVSHLKALGYNTSGLHGESPENYSRSVGYRGLGFENIHFVEDFENLTYYQSRRWPSDKSLYENMIRWYNEKTEDAPRFEYLLTMQNHADYNDNASEHDLVHVLKDYGESTDEINEYLTYVYQSGLAFRELTDYFRTVDRPVIICMLGDHCPPNLAEVVMDASISEEEAQVLLRQVPLMIWANFPLQEQDLGVMSMNYVVPVLLDIAGVRTSPYYDYLLSMHEQFPIVTSYGTYFDDKGNLYQYDLENAEVNHKILNDYFYLEYNNLSENRRQEFFDPR